MVMKKKRGKRLRRVAGPRLNLRHEILRTIDGHLSVATVYGYVYKASVVLCAHMIAQRWRHGRRRRHRRRRAVVGRNAAATVVTIIVVVVIALLIQWRLMIERRGK